MAHIASAQDNHLILREIAEKVKSLFSAWKIFEKANIKVKLTTKLIQTVKNRHANNLSNKVFIKCVSIAWNVRVVKNEKSVKMVQ